MAIGATGTPTATYSIPKYATSADIPNGTGFNSAMDFIDNLLATTFLSAPAGIVAGEGIVWDGTTFKRSSVQRLTTVRPQDLGQDAATTGQAMVWDGTKWAPGQGGAMQLISEQVLGSAAATIDFTSIPGTYRHLKLIGMVSSPDATVAREVDVQLNADTGNNYNRLYYSGHGAFAMIGLQSVAQPSFYLGNMPGTSLPFPAMFEMTLPYYKETTFYKGHVSNLTGSETSSNNIARWSSGGFWFNNAAVTSIKFLTNVGNFATGSRIALYGVN